MVDGTIPQERCDFYVYALLREDGRPFYVGKGSGKRCRMHLSPAKTDRTPRAKIIRKMLGAGKPLGIVKLAEGLTEIEAFALERETIASIGRHPNGPLWNMTDGGEGAVGLVHTPETRAVIGAAARAAAARPEAKRRQGERVRAAWADPEARARMHSAIQAAITPEVRAVMAAKLRETLQSPQWRQGQSERTRQAWAAKPESKKVQSQKSKARMAVPEARAAVGAAVKAEWDSPEGRAKKLASWTPERRAAQAERRRAQNAARWTPEERARVSELCRGEANPKRRMKHRAL